jgi:hypothetical protein
MNKPSLTASKNKLKIAAAKFGATVEWNVINRILDVNVDAPHRQVWKGIGVHTVGGMCRTDDPAWVADWVDFLIKDFAEGTEPCTEVDCEVCED